MTALADTPNQRAPLRLLPVDESSVRTCLDCGEPSPDTARCRRCRAKNATKARARLGLAPRVGEPVEGKKACGGCGEFGHERDGCPKRPREQLSLLRSSLDTSVVTLVVDPPEYEGWREELGAPRPSWPACRPAPGAPCGRVSCRHHLRLDLVAVPGIQVEGAEPMITINRQTFEDQAMGRRPGLTVSAADGKGEEFVNDAANLDEMSATCVLQLVERRGAISELEVADLLGVDPETVRRETVSAFTKITHLAQSAGYQIDWANPAEGLVRALQFLLGKRD